MKRIVTAALLAASSTFVAHSASAASVTTEFSGYGFKAWDRTYTTADDVKVHVSAATINKKTGVQTKAMTGGYGGQNGGLGVSSKGSDRFHVNGSADTSEVIWFEFASLYNVQGLLFTHADKDDDITIYTDQGLLGSFAAADFRNQWDRGTLSLAVKTTKLGILASGGGDEFLVRGIKGHAVPTPSAVLAGLGGLTMLAARRRRNAEQA